MQWFCVQNSKLKEIPVQLNQKCCAFIEYPRFMMKTLQDKDFVSPNFPKKCPMKPVSRWENNGKCVTLCLFLRTLIGSIILYLKTQGRYQGFCPVRILWFILTSRQIKTNVFLILNFITELNDILAMILQLIVVIL